MRLELFLTLGLALATGASTTAAQAATPPATKRAPLEPQKPQKLLPADRSLKRQPSPTAAPGRTERSLLQAGEVVDASDALDEMIDELAVDLVRLGPSKITPVLLERVKVSENMNPEFATVLEARIAAALIHAGEFTVVRCAECWAVHGEVQNGAWVVQRGVNSREDLQRLAANYGARSFLSASLTLQRQPDSLSLDVEIVNDQGAILYAEAFRINPKNAMLYRGADTSQKREEKLDELERRLNARPVFGNSAIMGAMMIPSTDYAGNYWGVYGGYRLYEIFGDEQQYRFGLSLAGYYGGSKLVGGLLSAALWGRVTKENFNHPQLHLGGTVGAFVTGTPGNTPFLGVQAEYVFGIRIALQASLYYLIPFQLGGGTGGVQIGGLTPQAGVAFLW